MARSCLDWTERRPHLAGRAGAALCAYVLEEGWCERIGSGRALRVTGKGRKALAEVLDMRIEESPEAAKAAGTAEEAEA